MQSLNKKRILADIPHKEALSDCRAELTYITEPSSKNSTKSNKWIEFIEQKSGELITSDLRGDTKNHDSLSQPLNVSFYKCSLLNLFKIKTTTL